MPEIHGHARGRVPEIHRVGRSGNAGEGVVARGVVKGEVKVGGSVRLRRYSGQVGIALGRQIIELLARFVGKECGGHIGEAGAQAEVDRMKDIALGIQLLDRANRSTELRRPRLCEPGSDNIGKGAVGIREMNIGRGKTDRPVIGRLDQA